MGRYAVVRALLYALVLFNCVWRALAMDPDAVSVAGRIIAGAIAGAAGVALAAGGKRKYTLTADEEAEMKKNKRERNEKVNARNAEARNQVKSPYPKGKRVTLEMAVRIYKLFCDGKGTPLAHDDPRQIEYWNKQKCSNSLKKILVVMPDGEIKPSARVNDMKHTASTAAINARRKVEGAQKQSAAKMGQNQKNPRR